MTTECAVRLSPKTEYRSAALAEARKPILRIRDYAAIGQFCRFFNDRAMPEGKICGFVLKSDAYGFGLAETAKVMRENGAQLFFTSDIWEAIAIRETLQDQTPIYTLHGFDAEQAALYHEHAISPVINTLDELAAYNASARQSGKTGQAALQIDSGMNRCGLSAGDAATLTEEEGFGDHVDIRFYMTHLHSVQLQSDCQAESVTQINAFFEAVSNLPPRPVSITATHGTLYIDHNPRMRLPQAIQRIGIGAFGDIPGHAIPFQVMARIVSVRSVLHGQSIGYDATFTARRDMKVAVLDIGYGDGYPSQLSNSGACVDIAGHQAPVIGKVSMNLTCVDVTRIPDSVLAGTRYAEIVGPSVPLHTLAARADLTPENILISLSRQNRRVHDLNIT